MYDEKTLASMEKLTGAVVEALEEGLSPLAVLRTVLGPLSARPNYHLTLQVWTPGDIQAVFDLSDREAADFMIQVERRFKDRMTELGWGVWESLGAERNLPTHPDEEL